MFPCLASMTSRTRLLKCSISLGNSIDNSFKLVLLLVDIAPEDRHDKIHVKMLDAIEGIKLRLGRFTLLTLMLSLKIMLNVT